VGFKLLLLLEMVVALVVPGGVTVLVVVGCLQLNVTLKASCCPLWEQLTAALKQQE
jgi:hypothetical protein